MKITKQFLTFTTLIPCLLTSIAHADAPPSFKHLKPLETLVDVWTTDFDPPGPVPAGQLEIHFNWMGNKCYLQSNVLFRPKNGPDDKAMNPEFTVVGFDLSTSKAYAWVFKYTTQGRMNAIVGDGKLVLTQQEAEPGDPNYRKQSKTYSINSEDQLVVSTEQESANGDINDEPDLVLTRSK